jgi:hypothetical protein
MMAGMTIHSKTVPVQKSFDLVRQIAPLANAGEVYLFQGENRGLSATMHEFISKFARSGPVYVVVGDNRISFDQLPRSLGEDIGHTYEIMDRIWVSRAETCYQTKDVLSALDPCGAPLVILDMLESFYEEDLSISEVTLTLRSCMERIHQLSEASPVVISASSSSERPSLIRLLEGACDQRFYFESVESDIPMPQPRMF